MTTIGIFGVAAVGAALAMPQARPLSAPTGSPELIETGPTGTTFVMSETRYQRFVEETGKANPDFVAIQKKPAGLSPGARFGINLTLRGKILSWVIDGDENDGYVLYADWNGNGDLTDDPPLRFDRVDGKYSLRVQREERDGDVTYPVAMKLVLDWVVPPGKTEKQLALKNYNRTTRTGQLVPAEGGKPIAFRLTGSSGFYAQSFNSVAFDLNADGAFDADTEVFRVSEKYVNVGDTSYEFAVDPHGRSLTLTPLAEHRPSRVALTAGSPAPVFTFTDLDGRARTLSEYRGKVVLLDFWGVWCAPCVAAAPGLVAIYEKFHDRGFEIIGIDMGDTREKMTTFTEGRKMRWAETMEVDKGPIQTLYRITGFPTYYLLDAEGKIRSAATGSADALERELEALLGGR
jgi:thiol-disulfide isomerase/thioredoxin